MTLSIGHDTPENVGTCVSMGLVMFDLVIFDCDGVLVDSEALASGIWKDFLAEHGIQLSIEDFNTRYAGKTDEIIRQVIMMETGITLPEDTAAQIDERAGTVFAQKLTAISGVKTAIEQITTPKCVCTNSSQQRLHRSLKTVGLFDLFPSDRLFPSTLVEHPKPSPLLHLYAAKITGFSPARIVVIEDSVTGVTAAKDAGMSAFGFTGASHLDENQEAALKAVGADLVFHDMSELPTLLAQAD